MINFLFLLLLIICLYLINKDENNFLLILIVDSFIATQFYEFIFGIPFIPILFFAFILKHMFNGNRLRINHVESHIYLLILFFIYCLFSYKNYYGHFDLALVQTILLYFLVFAFRIRNVQDLFRKINILTKYLLIFLSIIQIIAIQIDEVKLLISNVNHNSYLILFLFIYYIFTNERNALKSIYIFAFTFLAIFSSYSRTSIICLIIVMIYYLFRNSKKVYAFSGLLLLIFLFYLNFSNIIFRDFTIHKTINFDLLNDDQFTSGRATLNSGLLEMFNENPIYGYGHKSFLDINNSFNPYNSNKFRTQALSSHNVWLTVLAELGLIGLCLIVLFYLKAILYCLKKIKLNTNLASFPRAILLILIFYIIVGLTNNNFFENRIFFTIMLLLKISSNVRNSRSHRLHKTVL